MSIATVVVSLLNTYATGMPVCVCSLLSFELRLQISLARELRRAYQQQQKIFSSSWLPRINSSLGVVMMSVGNDTVMMASSTLQSWALLQSL